MDVLQTLRLEALRLAMGWNGSQGITCDACLLKTAEGFTKFVAEGDVTVFGHSDDEGEDEDEVVFNFDPEKPN